MLWALKRLWHQKNLTLEWIYFGFFGNNVPLDLHTVPIFCIYTAGRKWIQHTMGLGNNTNSGLLHRYQKLFSSIEFSRETLFWNVCVCRHSAHMCTCVQSPENKLGFAPWMVFHPVLETATLSGTWSSQIRWDWLVRKLPASSWCSGHMCVATLLWFLGIELACEEVLSWLNYLPHLQSKCFLTKVSSLPTVRKSYRP